MPKNLVEKTVKGSTRKLNPVAILNVKVCMQVFECLYVFSVLIFKMECFLFPNKILLLNLTEYVTSTFCLGGVIVLLLVVFILYSWHQRRGKTVQTKHSI